LTFDDPILSADLSTKLKIEVKPVEEEQKDSPKFGGGNSKANETFGAGSKFMPANNNANPPQQQAKGFLGVDALEPDMKKWGRVPMKNSQEEFIKMNEMNKNPLGKKVELQMYTLDDVNEIVLNRKSST